MENLFFTIQLSNLPIIVRLERRLFTMLIIWGVCLNINAQKVFHKSFDINNYKIENIDGTLRIIPYNDKDAWFLSDTDKPATPYYPIRILIPADYADKLFRYEVSFEKEMISTGIPLKGNPNYVTSSGEKCVRQNNKLLDVMNPVEDVKTINYGKYKYRLLRITPFLYENDTQNLYFVSNVDILVPELPDNDLSYDAVNDISSGFIASRIENPQDISLFYPRDVTDSNSYEDPVDYLIITSDTLSDSFQPLIEWKNRKGLRTRIECVESIRNNTSFYPFPDEQIKIKQVIEDYVLNHGTKWVLLGGDDSIVPTRYHKILGPSLNAILTPSDLYYSCFGDPFDWPIPPMNNNLLDLYDYDVDFNPSVYVSRIPIRTTEDIENFTLKLLAYERDIPKPNAKGRYLMTGYNVPDGYLLGAKHYGDYVYNNYINPYWNGTHYYSYPYENATFLPDEDDYENLVFYNDDLSDQMRVGYDIIHVVAHGSYNCMVNVFCMELPSEQYNEHPPVLLTNACHTNAFDYEDCLSEAFIRQPDGGGVAYFGSSRHGWSNEDGSADCSFMYNGLFFSNLLTGQPSNAPYCFGAVAAKAKLDMSEYCEAFDANRALQFSINPIGDPEMQIWTDNVESFSRNVNGMLRSPSIFANLNGETMTVTSTVDSCRIVVVNGNGEIFVKDNVRVGDFSGLSGDCKVTILKHNFKPYLTHCNFDYSPGVIHLSIQTRTMGDNLEINVHKTTDSEDVCIYEENSDDNPEWQLLISNVITGEKKIEKTVKGMSIVLNTSEWSSGFYVIKAVDGKYTASEKMMIK